MFTLTNVSADFEKELASALLSEGKPELANELPFVEISRCTFDQSVNAGYIYLTRPASAPSLAHLSTQIAETIAFAHPYWFNIDVDYNGHICGIELLSRNDIFQLLRAANAL